MSAYCTLADVKQRMSGDTPTVSSAWDDTITDAITDVSAMIDEEVRQVRGQPEGWSFLAGAPATRRYTGARGGSTLLQIDDAVAVSSVTILDPTGNVAQTLVENTDYLLRPLNSLPITGLILISGVWPWYPGGVQVGLTPGYANAVPADVKTAAIAEVIRTIRGGQAGEDDRLGIEPFRPQEMTKALLASTYRTIKRYRLGSGLLRGGF